MDRRTAITLVGSVSALGSSIVAATEPTKINVSILNCYAPDDVVIEDIFVFDQKVKVGEKLARLSSLQSARFKARIKSLESLIEIYSRPFIDGRVTQMLETIKAEAVAADVELTTKEVLYRTLKQRFEVGTATYTEVQEATAALESAKSKKLACDIQLAHEPRRTKDSLDKLALAKKHLDLELQYLAKFDDQLLLRAPQNGHFQMEVGLNGFVKKGDKIGVLKL